LCAGGLAALALTPADAAICAHLFELARETGPAQDPAVVGIGDDRCRAVMERRRAKMGGLRRHRYGICVVMADTLDEAGRC
jgi:hypothetical protein